MTNKVILIGNVGNDPEVRYVSEGLPVARFSLATSESYKDKEGKVVTNTEWHNLVVWRGLAKVVEEYVKKGSQLFIEGKITYRKYEKDGDTKYMTEIIVNELKMLGGRPDGAKSNSAQSAPQPQTVNEPAPIDLTPQPGDDLPF